MQIILENATPDFSRAVNGIPSINTQRAKTQVQVSDGETTVIGGIYVSQESTRTGPDAGPRQHSAARVALQARSVERANTELLIFITPRIIKTNGRTPCALSFDFRGLRR